jgi:membrane protease YdiL (CAAX protease family)
VTNLVGLWCGLAGAALFAARRRRTASDGPAPSDLSVGLSQAYGLRFRPVDLPLGIAVGVASQYLLAPLLELPLLPFVPHLFHRLGQPARSLTGGVSGTGLVVLGVLICAGSPFFEELFFRGLLLRGLLGRLAGLGVNASAISSIVVTGVVFGLVHFEPLQLIALCGFGMVLSYLATATGRLGPGMVAHAAFNATTFIALATLR